MMIETLLKARRPDYGVLPCGWLAADIDTFAMDNGGTAKEGVGRTYAGGDGYCPLASYIGAYGWCLELSLRPGTQHSARHTEGNLGRVIPLAQGLSAAGSKAPVLARLDSGFDWRGVDDVFGDDEPARPSASGLADQMETTRHGPRRDGCQVGRRVRCPQPWSRRWGYQRKWNAS